MFCNILLLFALLLTTTINLSAPAQAQEAKPGAAKALNPDVSANVLGLYRNGNRGNDAHDEAPNGFSLQEVELQFSADVDPFFRATAILGIHREHSHAEEHEEEEATAAEEEEEEEGEAHEEHEHGEAGYTIEPEEAFIETIALPVVAVKAGKFYTALGKHNTLHTHAFPFIDAPLANQRLLGDHGLNDVGVSVATLLPAPWFSELTVQGLSGESELFASENANEMLYVGRFRNLFELSDALTFDLGVSGATGENETNDQSTLAGADVTVKWRPVEGGKYSSLSWTTEFLQADQGGAADDVDGKRGGVGSWVQWQFAQRWWVQARAEQFGIPKPDYAEVENKQSYLIGFFPSEFSALRAQYDRLDDGAGDPEERFSLQMNVSIGAHPAHAY